MNFWGLRAAWGLALKFFDNPLNVTCHFVTALRDDVASSLTLETKFNLFIENRNADNYCFGMWDVERTHDVCVVAPKGGKDAAIKGQHDVCPLHIRFYMKSVERNVLFCYSVAGRWNRFLFDGGILAVF